MSPEAPVSPLRPRSIDEVVATVRAHPSLLPVGAGTKPALSTTPPGAVAMSL